MSQAAAQRQRLWGDISERQWNNWQWQQANRLRTAAQLGRVVALTDDERLACERAAPLFAVACTPYYATLMDADDPRCPIRRQVIPTMAELEIRQNDMHDPLAEDSHLVAPGLTHRYPDRALLYSTHNCPVYCRHCNRKRKVGDPTTAMAKNEHDEAVAYLQAHSEIRDVLISGGDPLSFSDFRLEELLKKLRAIPHLEIIRLASRNPVTLPQRVTADFAQMLRRYHPIFVNTHFNHVKECTEEAGLALQRLADAGCVLGNQMVLLRGINEEPEMVKGMYQWLLRHRCRPYYIFQCDPAEGISHFKAPIDSGLRLIESLRGFTSGLAVPHYVVDLPGGGGKVSLQPEYLQRKEGSRYVFKNYAGDTFTYDDTQN